MRAALAGLVLLSFAPHILSAQSGRATLVPISPELLAPSEEESISCTRRRAQEDMQIQRQPQGRFAARTGEFLPVIWSVTLQPSGRNLTIELESGFRPREVVIINGLPRSAGRRQENVRVRFLNDGSVQDGQRAVTPSVREPGPATPATSMLDSLDGPQLYDLARELAFRCERGIFAAVPLGSTRAQIPPR